MATCRKLTVKEQIAKVEREAGKLTPEVKKNLELSLSLGPAPYVCNGSGVGSLAGSPKPKLKPNR